MRALPPFSWILPFFSTQAPSARAAFAAISQGRPAVALHARRVPYSRRTRHKGDTPMHNRTTAVVLAAALLLTACSSSGNDADDKPSTNPSNAGLAKDWGPTFTSLATTEPALCNLVGDQACADHVAAIASNANKLEDVVEKTGGSYPRTKNKIMKIMTGSTSYTLHECSGDENAGIEGSPCPDDVFQVRAAAETLPFTLEADEAMQ
ncbi:hypothetical protein [Streptomyces sp. NPDC052127]|uniref:hypothetical protein n=1 Tax=Streptomyces sp. NPDC052127 TaxID=3155679 RepID=UPI0034343D25